eukprot:m.5781 g.5781  ORF g.5781 m.5781 type:complete len:365 (-) comp2477_c0_seq1:1019-2113(-)
MSKPSVLILGGAGFIGRHLVVYLAENDLASKIRVADKAVLQTSYLTARQQAAFQNVEFIQANLANDASVDKAFAGDEPFDYVFNCAAMTKYGQGEAVYQEHVYTITIKCAKKALEKGCKRFIEVSTAQVYEAGKKQSAEDSKLKPWTDLAKMKLTGEEELAHLDGLDFCIVRPSIVYGSSDKNGLMPRLIMGAVYKKLGETMKFLWTKDLRLNTVHVEDVAAALWLIATTAQAGSIFNLADKADTTQGTLNALLEQLYGIKTGFLGSMLSNLAKMNMSAVVDESNDKHMQPWSEMCRESEIFNTPLSPYLDKELLKNNSTSVDGSKIEEVLGFQYKYEAPTVKELQRIVEEAIEQNIFPPGYLS